MAYNENTLGVDAPRVTEEKALALMVHHLELAAMYFEATPLNCGAAAEKLMTQNINPLLRPTPALLAMRSWLAAIEKVYQGMPTI